MSPEELRGIADEMERRAYEMLAQADRIYASIGDRLRAKPKTNTHCANGHEYTFQNTRYDTKTGARRCRVCRSEQTKAYLKRKAAAEAEQ